MKSITLKTAFFELIRHEILGEPLSRGVIEFLNEENVIKIYKLSKIHDISQIIVSSLDKAEIISGKLKDEFVKTLPVSLLRCESQDYEIEKIREVFNKEEVPFIMLKGATVRSFYPKRFLRTSCDVDVLVKKTDLSRAVEVLSKNLNYLIKKGTAHDVFLYSQSGVHIELHHTLIEDGINKNANIELEKAFEKSQLKNGSEYLLSGEIFYLYHIAHMAKHALHGGCGVKPFIDLFLIKNNVKVDDIELNKLLKKCNLYKFYIEVNNLLGVWFLDKEKTETSLNFENYILQGGVYGTLDNSVKLNRAKKSSKKSYILSRIFLPYDKLKLIYPILEKHKILTPFYQVRRWFKLIFKKRIKKTKLELSINANLTE